LRVLHIFPANRPPRVPDRKVKWTEDPLEDGGPDDSATLNGRGGDGRGTGEGGYLRLPHLTLMGLPGKVKINQSLSLPYGCAPRPGRTMPDWLRSAARPSTIGGKTSCGCSRRPSLFSFVYRINRELIRRSARSVANLEIHHVGDRVAEHIYGGAYLLTGLHRSCIKFMQQFSNQAGRKGDGYAKVGHLGTCSWLVAGRCWRCIRQLWRRPQGRLGTSTGTPSSPDVAAPSQTS
jgi:hypothetical protein